MRHICLFPWYFKGGLLAEGKQKDKKKKKKALAARDKLYFSSNFHRVVVTHL